MRIWGYILIFLNVIAAGAYLYLATMVVKQKREWTDAALKAEFVSRGAAVETPEPIPPDDLEENFKEFRFSLYGIQEITQLPKELIKKLIPSGGTPTPNWPFPARADEFVTNQSAEVERIRKIFDDEANKLADKLPELRKFLATYLIDLARSGAHRDGINALLRDYPDETWRTVARNDLPYLARTTLQQDALRAIADIAYLDDELVRQKPENFVKGRAALDLWAEKMLSFVVPMPIPDAKGARSEAAMTQQQEDKKTVEAALKALRGEASSETPDAAKIEQGKARLAELESGLPTKPKRKMAFLAAIAGNPLRSKEDVAEARKQLLELAQWQARTDAEKSALAGVADLLMPPPLDAKLTPEELVAEKQRRIERGPTDVAKAIMKQHFDEAGLPSSKSRPDSFAEDTNSPQDAQAALRDPEEKKTTIAHLLYNLDAHLYAKPAERKSWHERVAAILGYEAYVKEAEEQASALYRMIPRIGTLVLEEQTAFTADYQFLVQYSLYLAFRLEEVTEQLKEQAVLEADHKILVNARNTEKENLSNELTTERTRTKESLESLAKRQDELFRITKQLGEAQDALVGLEEKLRILELSFVKP